MILLLHFSHGAEKPVRLPEKYMKFPGKCTMCPVKYAEQLNIGAFDSMVSHDINSTFCIYIKCELK